MSKFKKIITNWRVIILILALLLSVLAIGIAPWNTGLAIKGVAKNSTAAKAGIPIPNPSAQPVTLERIIDVNGQKVLTEKEFNDIVSQMPINTTFIITTNINKYRLTTEPVIETITLNETEKIPVIVPTFDNNTNTTINETTYVYRNKTQQVVTGVKDIGLRIAPAAQNNVRKGLELSGGTRVLLKPAEKVSDKDLDFFWKT